MPKRPYAVAAATVLVLIASTTSFATASSSRHHFTGPAPLAAGATGKQVRPEASMAGDGPFVVQANAFTMDAKGLKPGQIELTTVSTRPTLVTEPEARIAVRGLVHGDQLRVAVNGRTSQARFRKVSSWPGQAKGAFQGVVHGLERGWNTVTAIVTGKTYGTRTVNLRVLVHSMQGPVITGPHQEPFICETRGTGLGKVTNAKNCTAKATIHWWYEDNTVGDFHRLSHPYAAYPSNVATTKINGKTVPFVVRVENIVINRSVTRLAVLDDPHARGRHKTFRPVDWDRRLAWHFGESCGTGFHQGSDGGELSVFSPVTDISSENLAGPVLNLPGLLGKGWMVGESSLTIFGVHCNQVLSAETLMMVKEYIANHYGVVRHVIGGGASGGAIQQYTIANGYPGVLDAGTPLLSFPDVVSTAMTVGDCVLLKKFFHQHPWHGGKQIAVSGLATTSVCDDWNSDFGGNLKPTSCPGGVPAKEVYNPKTNPHGVRCDLQDDLKNILGTTASGQALRPLDNVGVQYGLEALRKGQITAADFVLLNRAIGGVNLNGNFVTRREKMTTYEAHRIFDDSLVGEFGAINQTPIIDQTIPVSDDVPALDIHDEIRPYEIRARLLANYGSDASQAIWSGVPLPSSAIIVAEHWLNDLDALQAKHPYKSRAWLVAHSRPAEAADSCRVGGTGAPTECSADKHSSPRQVAGGPLAEDVLKCHLRPLQRSDYPSSLTTAQFSALKKIFPAGVCNYSRHSIGWVKHSRTWLSYGDNTLYRNPVVVPYPIARSRVPTAR